MTIASSMHQQHSFAFRILHRIVHPFFLGGEAFTKTHIDHFGAIIRRIANSQGNIFVMLVTIGYCTNSHDSYIVSNTIHAYAVVSYGADNA